MTVFVLSTFNEYGTVVTQTVPEFANFNNC
jgi:hypothetical protein